MSNESKRREIKTARCRYLLADAVGTIDTEALDRLFDPKYCLMLDPKAQLKGGRGQTVLFTLPEGPSLVMRHYKRGGLWGKLAGDRFFRLFKSASRSFEEFKMLEQMGDLGLPVPRPYLARECTSFWFKKCDIVIYRVERAADLAHILDKRALSAEEYLAIGRTVGSFFKQGVVHTDLNLRNILLDEAGKVYLIDFDKCYFTEPKQVPRHQIIARLERSFIKERTKSGGKVSYSPTDFAHLKEAALS